MFDEVVEQKMEMPAGTTFFISIVDSSILLSKHNVCSRWQIPDQAHGSLFYKKLLRGPIKKHIFSPYERLFWYVHVRKHCIHMSIKNFKRMREYSYIVLQFQVTPLLVNFWRFKNIVLFNSFVFSWAMYFSVLITMINAVSAKMWFLRNVKVINKTMCSRRVP